MDRLRPTDPILDGHPAGPSRCLVGAEHADRTRTSRTASEVLDWNQIFIDTLIATNTANSSSQRLGAIVHTAIFDAYNGIERRYTPIFVHNRAPHGASRRAAVIAAAYTALVGLFPSQQPALDDSYAASLAALSDDCEDAGHVAQAAALVHDAYRARHRVGNRGRAGRARLARDRWVQRGLPCVHRWDRGRPVAADAAGVRGDERSGVGVHLDVRPGQQHPVRPGTAARLDQPDVHGRFQRRQGARSQDRIDAHRRPDGARAVLGRQRQRPLESGGEPDRARQRPVHVRQQPASRGPEHRDGRHGVHDLERQAILRRAFRSK